MKVIIAEKPDQGAALAKPFPHKKGQGFIEILPNQLFPEGAYITWAIGHLLQLQSPEKYDAQWKKWNVETLPMIPEKFKYEVNRSKYKQYNAVKSLLQKPSVNEIIHAGDAGREGELIVRNIINMSGIKKPMKRLWISSLTPKAVTEGFTKLLDESETRSVFFEAYSRACADWIIGMNASRIYSILLKQKGMSDVFSAGRVQTPTLALIVKREKEIESFVSEPFWEVTADFDVDGKVYQGKWEKDKQPRLKDKETAVKIADFCKGKPAVIKDLSTERKEYQPPLLFNLSSLQATANKIFKFSPQKTLDTLQKLYQKGIVSYPRSDSNYVTKGEAETFPEILEKLGRLPAYQELFPLPVKSLLNNKRYVNEQKVTDHYAIIPTEQVKNPEKLPADEQKIYDLVVRRLIAAHFEKSIFDYSTLITLVDGRAEFVSKGKIQIQEGWRKVIFQQEKDDEQLLPNVNKGDNGLVKNVKVKEGKTQPPKRYTEGQLITLMKTAGRHLEDEELEKVLSSTEGLGTEATRANIIAGLKDRKYIDVKRNAVYATDKGKVLIEAIGEKILASPEMTAKWEQRLGEIGQGRASAPQFMEQVKKLSGKIISDAIEASKDWSFDGIDTDAIQRTSSRASLGKSIGSCPYCKANVLDKGEFYGCSAYKKTKCSFTLSKMIMKKKISPANAKKLIEEGKTGIIKGFKKGEKSFDAVLKWDNEERKLQFEFKN
ncbi:DNA topoisomerase III [Rossellomorea vietnamensis]|uniref:DNA topoisomerase n=1 Tax=Rossellomorea vietnamensis TaxID=218284 RepID=A0A5D4NTF8_9BACI|nr:DNA topoisomerase III [Rossellomorea vietnamensis]TYS17575.1 DNA topoisomerase III [Rossellomorea vietnamensis]